MKAISFNLVGLIILISIFVFNALHPISSLKANTEEVKEFNLFIIWKNENESKYEEIMKTKKEVVKTKSDFLNGFVKKEIEVKKYNYSYKEITEFEKDIEEYKEAVRQEAVYFQYLINSFLIFIVIFLFKRWEK